VIELHCGRIKSAEQATRSCGIRESNEMQLCDKTRPWNIQNDVSGEDKKSIASEK